MRAGARTKGLVVHGAGVATGATGEAGGQEVTWGASKVLVVTTARIERVCASVKGAGAGSASHRGLSHAILRRVVHGGGISGIGHDSGTGAASSAAKAAYILGKVMVSADFVATLPVASTERDNATAATAHASTMSHMAVAVTTMSMATVVWWRHDLGRTIAGTSTASTIAKAVSSWTSSSSWEGASEAGSSALEVGEAA